MAVAFYNEIFTRLDAGLNTYWTSTAASVMAAITPVAETLMLIYFCFWGWAMMRGMIDEPITDGATRVVRLTVICGIALMAGNYATYIADFLWQTPDAIAAIIAGPFANATSNANFLDTTLSNYYDMYDAMATKASTNSTLGIPDLSMLCSAWLVLIGGMVMTAYAAFLLSLAKISLALILGLGPIFILLTIFEPTKRFFDAWLGQAVNNILLVALTSACLRLVLSIIQGYMGSASVVASLADPGFMGSIPIIVFSVIGFLVLMQVPSVASALGGGVAMSTLGAAGAAFNKLQGGASGAKNLLTGKTLSDMRGARRAAATNARWAKANPGASARMASAAYKKITSRPNKVAKG